MNCEWRWSRMSSWLEQVGEVVGSGDAGQRWQAQDPLHGFELRAVRIALRARVTRLDHGADRDERQLGARAALVEGDEDHRVVLGGVGDQPRELGFQTLIARADRV